MKFIFIEGKTIKYELYYIECLEDYYLNEYSCTKYFINKQKVLKFFSGNFSDNSNETVKTVF